MSVLQLAISEGTGALAPGDGIGLGQVGLLVGSVVPALHGHLWGVP